ncbi:Major facilitator superfamily domain, general substrate transporter [Niveomyces insectorum RCEF 264]|uniref:Major facilitator superfamily domain, general substrate transporter n=1 Tax=Niveomyces insectorum RCEF 264 TaxID=1081102 RepID=A0A162K6P0_9HYPO|nr:Major facilitator superfamily domain, general substrate transporter [Niveomyces insectorum RCEF 264]
MELVPAEKTLPHQDSKSGSQSGDGPGDGHGDISSPPGKNLGDADVAARIVAAAGDYEPITQAEMNAVRRKIDWHMVPLLTVCMQLSGWDKVVIGTAAIYGLKEDLNLSGSQYSWTGSIMYFAFLLGIFPTLYLLQRLPTGKYLAVNIICWGIVELCHAACTNAAGLLVCRFFLGLFQCCDLPAMIIIATMWWTKSEQPVRNAVICSVTSSIGNGLISYGFGHLTHSALPKWKYIFIAVGSFTVLFGIIAFIFLPDSPAEARWLSPREKLVAVERLRDEKLGMENKHFKWEQAREAVLDKKNWVLWLFFISVNIPNGGLIAFATIVINELGFTATDSSLMTIPTGIVSTLSGIFFSYLLGRTRNYRALVTAASLLPCLAGTIIMYTLPRTNKGGQVVGLYLAYVYWAPYVCGLAMFQANTAGRSKKTTVNAMDYVAYAVGNIVGPQTFIAKQSPQYTGAIISMLLCYALCIVLAIIYGLMCRWENNQRDKAAPAGIIDEHAGDFLDLTDKQNQSFRYTT